MQIDTATEISDVTVACRLKVSSSQDTAQFIVTQNARDVSAGHIFIKDDGSGEIVQRLRDLRFGRAVGDEDHPIDLILCCAPQCRHFAVAFIEGRVKQDHRAVCLGSPFDGRGQFREKRVRDVGQDQGYRIRPAKAESPRMWIWMVVKFAHRGLDPCARCLRQVQRAIEMARNRGRRNARFLRNILKASPRFHALPLSRSLWRNRQLIGLVNPFTIAFCDSVNHYCRKEFEQSPVMPEI